MNLCDQSLQLIFAPAQLFRVSHERKRSQRSLQRVAERVMSFKKHALSSDESSQDLGE